MEIKDQESVEKDPKVEKKDKLPPCTTAPSAEHARGSEEEEPCDDGRQG